jgi:hypothetical protein
MAGQPLRILTILARYGTEQYRDAVDQIGEWFDKFLPGAIRTVIIVDTALPPITTVAKRGFTLLGADNTSREFSAFDRGMAFARADLWNFDVIHFATSAFNTLYVGYLERFDAELIREMMEKPASVGHIDCYNEPVEIFGCQTQHWIRSCFFFMPPAEAKALGSFVSVDAAERFFSGDPAAPFRADAPLSARYQRYIFDWLTGGDIGQNTTWHSAFGLTADSLPAFEQKALSIMNEQLLGVRLRAQGCSLIDVTWLATMMGSGRLSAKWWKTQWHEQLAGRDRDRILVAAPALASPRR